MAAESSITADLYSIGLKPDTGLFDQESIPGEKRTGDGP